MGETALELQGECEEWIGGIKTVFMNTEPDFQDGEVPESRGIRSDSIRETNKSLEIWLRSYVWRK